MRAPTPTSRWGRWVLECDPPPWFLTPSPNPQLSALQSTSQAALPTPIDLPNFLAAFAWLLPDPPIANPIQPTTVSIIVGGDALPGLSAQPHTLPFYLPPATHPSPEACLWHASNALLQRSDEHSLLQEHDFTHFWAAFEPQLCDALGDPQRLASHQLLPLRPFLASIAPLRTVVGGSASTGTVLSRADWDVLVVLTTSGVCIKPLPDNTFELTSPEQEPLPITRDILCRLGNLYIECFRDFVRSNPHIAAPFIPYELGAMDCDENITRVFRLPTAGSIMDSFTLVRRDGPPDEDLADVLPAIPSIGNTLVLVPGAARTDPVLGRDRFLDLAAKRPGLLQLAALLKKLLRTLGPELALPSCASTRLAYDIADQPGWPPEQDHGPVWSLSSLVTRALQRLLQYLDSGEPLAPLTGAGDLLDGRRQPALANAVQELLDAGCRFWLRPTTSPE